MIFKSRSRSYLLITIIILSSFGCSIFDNQAELKFQSASITDKYDAVAAERDEIYSLLAYAVVLKDWQDNDMKNNRGYNIGSVLVDNQKNEVVYWARNSVNIAHNMTQHGEVRLMNCYLASKGNSELKNLRNYAIYTTLEPCAMCSGMMMLTSVPFTVYGQSDPGYGKAIERLQLDSTGLGDSGYLPYPRIVKSIPASLPQRHQLENLYSKYYQEQIKLKKDPHITEFLATDEAKEVFTNGLSSLLSYKIKFQSNQAVLDQALSYYNRIPSGYVEQCPAQ